MCGRTETVEWRRMVRALAGAAAVLTVRYGGGFLLALAGLGWRCWVRNLMVLPVVYTPTLAGIRETDARLLEMAAVFRVPPAKRVRYLYVPAALPYFRSACTVGLGLCWKSGVAAEVIGITSGSIGEALYNAKILFSTAELLAWTVVIVLLSLAFERLFLWGLARVESVLLERSGT